MKHYFLLFIFLLIGTSCKEKNSTNLNTDTLVYGTTPKNFIDKKLYLQYINNDSVFTETVIVNSMGKFEFNISNIEYPAKAFITNDISNNAPKMVLKNQLGSLIYFQFGTPTVPEQFGHKKDLKFLLLEKGKINILIKDSIYNSDIKGSKLNEELEELALNLKPVMKKLNSDTITDQLKYLNEKSNILDQFINGHRKSFVSILAINLKPNLTVSDLKIFNKIDPQLRNHKFADISKIKLAPFLNPVNLNDTIEDFSLQNTGSNEIDLYNIKSKYILIDFWASWCIPCRKENLKMAEFYPKYKKTDFQIVGISVDKDKEEWLNALKEDNIKWISLNDNDGKINDRFGVNSYPTNFLLDSDFRVIAKNLNAKEINEFLNKLLK